MNIRKAIADFIRFHEVEKSSQYTIRNYRRNLGRFADWLESTCDVYDTDGLQLAHLRDWVGYIQTLTGDDGKPLKDTTIHHYGAAISIFCHWLEYEGVIEKPITTRFKLPKMEQSFVPTFTPEEVERMLDACEEGNKNWPQSHKALTARNRAIVSVLVDTGIRLSELVGLRLCDVDRDLRVLLVHRKGNKWQQVPISRDGFKPLHDYLVKHRRVLAEAAGRTVALKEDAVFLSAHGEPLTIGGVASLFVRIRKRAGIEGKKVSAHNCRRYMATSQLAMGRSPLDVQRQMGHTTLQMTNRYASLSVEHLQRSHEEFSPWRLRRSSGKNEGEKSGYWDE